MPLLARPPPAAATPLAPLGPVARGLGEGKRIGVSPEEVAATLVHDLTTDKGYAVPCVFLRAAAPPPSQAPGHMHEGGVPSRLSEYLGGGGGAGNFGTPKFWCVVYSCRNHSPWGARQKQKKTFRIRTGYAKSFFWIRRIHKNIFLG